MIKLLSVCTTHKNCWTRCKLLATASSPSKLRRVKVGVNYIMKPCKNRIILITERSSVKS